MRREILRLERVTCCEHGVIQLDEFNLNIPAGEIVGLLPLNNHGLSALLELLRQNIPLSYGYVYYREEQINTWRGAKERRNRIGIVQSEDSLVDALTVADNIFVLRPEFKTYFLKHSILQKQLLSLLKSVNLNIPVDIYAGELSAFERIAADILKSVVAGCKLIVLRDISTDIFEDDLIKIHSLIKHFTKQGIAFLYIDFNFRELNGICDKIALMSNGRIIKVHNKTSQNPPEAFLRFTKEETVDMCHNSQVNCLSGKSVFECKDLTGNIVKNLSFSVAGGECVILQNPDIQLFNEFLSIINGDTHSESGSILIENRNISSVRRSDIAIIQELPANTMLFNEMSYLDNLCFSLDRRLPEIWRSRKAKEGVRREYSKILGNDVFDKRIDSLSEKQKYDLIYTRIAIQKPKIAFFIQPFRRADIELRKHIEELLKRLLKNDIAVVILTINLTDNLSFADRLIKIQK